MKDNIFDTKNTSDLPDEVRQECKKFFRNDTEQLLSLFDIKDSLNIDEIIIGLFRKYKLQKTRTWVSSTVYNLSRKNLLESLGNGVYKKYK